MDDKAPTRNLLPLFLDITGRAVLVAGAGAIASRKALDLMEAGARVHVVAPLISPELEAARGDALTIEERPFEERDIDGMWLVFAATDDPVVQRRIADQCERAQVFCIAIDDPPNATAYGGAIIRRGPITIAISTSGEAPALARLMREVLEQAIPDETYVEAARALREKWKADKVPFASRFAELVEAFKPAPRE